jgi:hypothetical protein
VVYRLVNQNDPIVTLNLTSESWYGILDLAEQYGWNPMGTVRAGIWEDLEAAQDGYFLWHPVEHSGNGNGSESRLVVLEDALNLADALDQAFLDYEPLRVPASFYFFEPADLFASRRPSIGAIAALLEFCRTGAFWIELYSRRPNGTPQHSGDGGCSAYGVQPA